MIRFAACAVAALVLGLPVVASARPGVVDFKVVRTIPGPDGFWDYASFDPVLRRVYVAHGDRVMTIDADTGKVDADFAPASRAHAVLPLNDGRDLLTTNSGDNTARIFDARTGALEASIPTTNDPDAAVYDPSTGRVFVMNGDAGKITVIDPVARKAVGSIDVGGGLEAAAANGKGRLFVNIENQNKVAVVDSRSGKVVARYALPRCEGPTGMAATANGLLVSACANGVADVLDAGDGRLVASLKIGPRPDAVIYDRARSLAYIPSGGDGALAVITLGRGTARVANFATTQVGARTGALDPKTQELYLPVAGFTPPPASGKRPGIEPGSFKVLVLAPR